MGGIFRAHTARSESHIQQNASREVATTSPPFHNEPYRASSSGVGNSGNNNIAANLHRFASSYDGRHFLLSPRGVTRLDGAPGKKQVWRPHVRT